MFRGRLRLSAAVLTLAALASGLSTVAAAADPVPAVTAGTLLPARQKTELPAWGPPLMASSEYVAYMWEQPSETGGDAKVTVRRIEDGALVRTIAYHDDSAHVSYFRLSGQYLLKILKDSVGGTESVDAIDISSGNLAYRQTFADSDGMIAADVGWALVLRSVSDGYELHVVRPDGSDTQVLGTNAHAGDYVRGADARTILLGTFPARLWSVDADTGVATLLTSDVSWTGDGMLTPARIYWTTGSGDSKTIHWRSRTDGETGSIEYTGPWANDFIGYGDRVAARYYTPDSAFFRLELRPVDLATGAVETSVLGNIASLTPMGNGGVAAAVSDTPAGRIVTVEDGSAPHEVGPFSEIELGAAGVALSGGTVAASFSENNGAPGGVLTAPATGVGGWSEVAASDNLADAWYEAEPFAFSNGVTVRRLQHVNYNTDRSRIWWPGGFRDITMYGTPVLGEGGTLIATASTAWQVQDVRSGEVLATLPAAAGIPVLRGTWAWQLSEKGPLRGVDTSGAQADRVIDTGLQFQSLRAINGRWALIAGALPGHSTGGTFAVDLLGVVEPWLVPTSGYDRDPVLGNGFVAWASYLGDTSGSPSLIVADLAPGHGTRIYGPLRGRAYPPGPAYAANDTSTTDLVYLDPESQVRHVVLDWLGTAPSTRSDRTAPQLIQVAGSPALMAASGPTTRLTLAWQYQEPTIAVEPQSGIANYDVRSRQWDVGAEPSEWAIARSATAVTSLNWDVAPNTNTCFQTRSRDKAGNVSDWSAEHCTEVAAGADAFGKLQSPLITATARPVDVSYFVAGSDRSSSAYLQIAFREAARGKELGSWIVPSGWAHFTGTDVTRPLRAGGEVCFRVRAVNRVGTISPWTEQSCTVAPWGSDGLKPFGSDEDQGKVLLATDRRATDRGVLVLTTKGAGVRSSEMTGRQIGVWVVRGPKQGKVDVFVGKQKVGRINLTASRWRSDLVVLDPGKFWKGRITIRSVNGKQSRIDALAVVR